MCRENNAKRSRYHWFHVPVQLIVLGFCVYWYFHLPAPSKAVLILTGVTVFMAVLDMRPINKAFYLLLVICLMYVENRAIDSDRQDASKAETKRRDEQNAQFQNIADQISIAMANSQAEFNKTMQQFAGMRSSQQTTIARLSEEEKLITEQSVTSMSDGSLAEEVRAIMRDVAGLQQYFVYNDSELSNMYFDKITATSDQSQQQKLIDEEANSRSNNRAIYDAQAKKLIARAAIVRAEIVRRLFPNETQAQDTKEQQWFDNPTVGGGSTSLLNAAGNHIQYLGTLADRLLNHARRLSPQ